ncbi:DVU_1555 family C-GCAxxG-C-C protein [Desulfosarcina ovata]|uniref:Redox-active protein n=1 Tax=Desulfosarcina ovata subsp. ovata TaxID=2752305 RepID=A0A5K8AJD7_9BACT|nr:DV_1555 family C-GCAxxG-C-C protein [Desulfosarcina ovata]BBO91784.1 hypothetical protein DSCOOX_49640 [Desulfosarcina ovata subsp. ovata]
MDDNQIRMLQLAAGGYTCSQIIVQLALDARGEENPLLVRAMAGLAYGCGNGRASCGALTGGCCLLGLYVGKGSDTEKESDRLPLMLGALTAWFEEAVSNQYGGMTCDAITGADGPAAARQRCAGMVADTFAKVMEIVVENGFDPFDAN